MSTEEIQKRAFEIADRCSVITLNNNYMRQLDNRLCFHDFGHTIY